jgi:hypothetical protein
VPVFLYPHHQKKLFMSLQKITDLALNEFSETVKNYLKENKLKRTDTAKFRLLTGHTNVDKLKHGGDTLYNSVICIPLCGTLNDPENGLVDFGVVKAINPITKMPSFRKFYVRPKRNDGIFTLRGDVVADLEIYDAILLSNDNKSNPYRDASREPTFERVDEVKESKVRSTKRNFLYDSLHAIKHFTPDELRVAAAAYNIPSTLEPDVLKDRLEQIAEKDPETFYKTIDSDDNMVKALIKIATEKGIIAYSAHENKWFYVDTQETIALLDRREGVNENDQLKEFLKSSANGPAIQGNIQKILKAKKNNP